MRIDRPPCGVLAKPEIPDEQGMEQGMKTGT